MSDAVKSSLRIVGSIVRLYIFPNGQRLSVVAVSTARFQVSKNRTCETGGRVTI
ncbi:hypothetical protein Plhal304r1_c005g0021571 [Plasmopara halstedii]